MMSSTSMPPRVIFSDSSFISGFISIKSFSHSLETLISFASVFSLFKLIDESQVVRISVADVLDAVLQHRHTVRTHAECKAAVLLGVIACHLQNIRMHHAGA